MRDSNEKGTGMDLAQELLAELRDSYLAELPDQISDLEALVLKLEQKTQFAQHFEQLFRKAHSMKGSGGTYGFPIITSICHQLEDQLKRVQGGGPQVSGRLIDTCLAYVDLLRQANSLIVSGTDTFAGIEQELAAIQGDILQNRRRCVIVSGSKTTVELCSHGLRQLDIEYVVSDDGYYALERLLHERFDLLVSGVELKQLNGFALLAALRLSGSVNADIPAILLTSSLNPPPQLPAAGFDRILKVNAAIPQALHDAATTLLEN